MNDDARKIYEEQLRLIAEDEACAVEAAHLSAALKRNAAHRKYIHEKERILLASSKKSGKATEIVQPAAGSLSAPAINITTNVNTNAGNAPTYNQMGDGGQYVAEQMYTVPDAS